MGIVVRLEPRMAAFEEFWQVYPKKADKPLTRAKWEAITNGGLDATNKDRETGQMISVGVLQATPEEIIEGAKRYRATQIDEKRCRSDDYTRTILKDGGRWTMCPYTWLNRGGWMNE
jgi:hypothetical protein